MRILWASNISSASAYAQQSMMMFPYIKALGHDITALELGNASRKPYMINDDIRVLPVAHDPLANDCILERMVQSKADVVVTLVDVWRFDPSIWTQVNWWAICPVDHAPLPPDVAKALSAAKGVIALSRYGQEKLRAAGFDALYAPHMVDPTIFYPIERAYARAQANIPHDSFWVTFVGVNDSVQSRKGIPELLVAWKAFSDRHPDAVLYLHTAISGNLPINGIGGVRIDHILNTLEVRNGSVRICDQSKYLAQSIPQTEIATILAASDVFILPSRGEGFGVPLIEAQATGTPVITTDFAAGAELVGAGWKVGYEVEWTFQNAFCAKPGIADIVDALEDAYRQRHNQQIRQQAMKFAERFHIQSAFPKYWQPVFNAIAERSLEVI